MCLGGLPYTLVDESCSSDVAGDYLDEYHPHVTAYYARKLLLNKTAAWVFLDRWLASDNDGKLYCEFVSI